MSMSEWVIYHNPQCSKSREALSYLRERKIEPRVVEYLKSPPTADELHAIIGKLSGPASGLVRVKEDEYKKLQFDLNSADEIAQNLAQHPKLIERPIIIREGRAVVARPLEAIEALFQIS